MHVCTVHARARLPFRSVARACARRCWRCICDAVALASHSSRHRAARPPNCRLSMALIVPPSAAMITAGNLDGLLNDLSEARYSTLATLQVQYAVQARRGGLALRLDTPS